MIRKSGCRFSLATNAKRLRGDHAQTIRSSEMTIRHHALGRPLLLIRLEMRVGGAQPGYGNFRGIAARDEVADHVIGFDRLARSDVAEHRGRHWRTLGGEETAGAL